MATWLCLIAGILAASVAQAGDIIVVHNSSRMSIQVGLASEDVSAITIKFLLPSSKMRRLVRRGATFFDGKIDSESGLVEGQAHVYRQGCEPISYFVVGVFEKPQSLEGRLKLVGPAPVFEKGKGKCETVRFAFTPDSELLFIPVSSSRR